MLNTLVESRPRRSRSLAQAISSLGLHVVLGGGAIEATRRTLLIEPPRAISTIPYQVPPRPTLVTAPATGSSTPLAQPVPVDPIIASTPADLPLELPPIQSSEPIDPRRFVIGRPEWAKCLPGCRSSDSAGAAVFLEDMVDEPARVLSQPTPIYPPLLKAAGIVGRVVIEFVVDQSGGVEPGSVTVVEVSNSGFERSARAAVSGARFSPAKIRGAPVRQLVRQGISFRIS